MIILYANTVDFQTSDISLISKYLAVDCRTGYNLTVMVNNKIKNFPANKNGFKKAVFYNTNAISLSQI